MSNIVQTVVAMPHSRLRKGCQAPLALPRVCTLRWINPALWLFPSPPMHSVPPKTSTLAIDLLHGLHGGAYSHHGFGCPQVQQPSHADVGALGSRNHFFSRFACRNLDRESLFHSLSIELFDFVRLVIDGLLRTRFSSCFSYRRFDCESCHQPRDA